MSKKLTPVELVIRRFGACGIGLRALGRLLGMSDYVVAAWRHRGIESIPNRRGMQRRLLDLAKKEGVELTPDELINGGTL